MNIIRLATRLGLTDELKDNLIESYRKDKHTTKLEAAEYVCSKYVENELCQMKKSIKILQKAVEELDLITVLKLLNEHKKHKGLIE